MSFIKKPFWTTIYPWLKNYKPLAVSLGGPDLLVTQSQSRVGAQAGWARQQRQPRARGARWDARSPSWTLTALVGQTRSAANAAGSKRPTGPEPFPPSKLWLPLFLELRFSHCSQCIGLLAWLSFLVNYMHDLPPKLATIRPNGIPGPK